MTRPALRRLLLGAVQTDAEARFADGVWRTRCLHCRAALHLDASGEALDGATLEHVVPRSWFRKAAARPLLADLSGPDDLRNLALACARCNQQKGKGPDALGPGDARALTLVAALQATRRSRWRPL